MSVRGVIERGPKGKRAVAFALDWPGWSRGDKTPEAALARLESYRSRYRPIAVAAGFEDAFNAAGAIDVLEDRVGTGSTDFWGISFTPCSLEPDPIGEPELERRLTILKACWAYFDAVSARVSADLRKGPRGGGRDRDRIISHVLRVESEEFATGVGLRIPENGALEPGALQPYRVAYLDAIRAYDRGETPKRMRTGTLAFLIRHSAFHTMDHAWEMEDRDLTSGPAAPTTA